jgi:hypothetical protein
LRGRIVEVVREKSQRKGIVEVRLVRKGGVYRGERLLVVANDEW